MPPFIIIHTIQNSLQDKLLSSPEKKPKSDFFDLASKSESMDKKSEKCNLRSSPVEIMPTLHYLSIEMITRTLPR
jgi:hypothetical protein